MKHNAKILIIGAGPTGMTMACHLLQHGISCRIIDKNKHQTTESKAINLNSASLQMFDRMRIANRFMVKGKEIEHVYCHWENKRVVHVDYSRIDAPYHFFLCMPQSMSEGVIAEYLKELGGVVEREVEFFEAEVKQDYVKVKLKHIEGDIEETQFDYLLACDGARSNVREHLNIPFKGSNYNTHYHLFDGFIESNPPVVDVHYHVTEKGYFIIAPMIEGYYRIVLFDETKGKHTCTQDELQELIDLYGPGHISLKKVTWQSKGFFYNRLLDDFRYGKRVFFAGDAAHIFSPLGGHGMNTSLHDTDNLAWKLAGVINYGWNDKILDTYTEERKEVARVLIKNTDFSTRLINKTERDFIPNLDNWLPLLHKRGVVRNRTAYQFSGLALQFFPSEFVQLLDSSEYFYDSIVGKYLPYVGDLECNGKILDTYQLSQKTPVFLSFGECHARAKSVINDFGFHVFNIIIQRGNNQNIDTDLCTTVVDPDNKIMRKCYAKLGDILLLRPDGVISYKGNGSSVDALTDYLDCWFTKEEALAC